MSKWRPLIPVLRDLRAQGLTCTQIGERLGVSRTAADAFRLGLRGPLWALKLTEHVWIEPEPYDWTDAEDDIADAISDSMDMDWNSRDGARAVVAYLKQIGAKLS